MIKELKYNGHTANPSDYECTDGDLALAIGVIPEDGALKPLLPPTRVKGADGNFIVENVVFTHETAAFTHYIFYSEEDGTAWSIDKKSGKRNDLDPLPGDLIRFSAVGNILLALTSEGLCYYYWRNDEYVCLGGHVPEIDLSFGLVGHPRIYSVENDGEPYKLYPIGGTIQTGEGNDTQEGKRNCRKWFYDRLSDDHEETSSGEIMALVNKYLADQTVNEGRFCLPFFVRYAVRLYDGSYVHQSAPVLMTPSTYGAMTMYCTHDEPELDRSGLNNWRFYWMGLNPLIVACDLDYMLVPNADTANLENWRDIIAGIDIFVSAPIYTHDQDGGTKGYWELAEAPRNTFVGRLYYENTDGSYPEKPERDKVRRTLGSEQVSYYAEWDYNSIYALYMGIAEAGEEKMPARVIRLPIKDAKAIEDDICNASTFYLLHSIDFDALVELARDKSEGGKLYERQIVPVSKEYLQSLVARETLDDDYNTHDILFAASASTYNNRLHLSGVRRKLFDGFNPLIMFSYCNSFVAQGDNGTYVYNTKNPAHSISEGDYGIVVYVRERGEHKVKGSFQADAEHKELLKFTSELAASLPQYVTDITKPAPRTFGCYLFYPNPGAYKMAIYYNSPDHPVYAVDLKPHDLLNGAYAFLGFDQVRMSGTGISSLPSTLPPVVPDAPPQTVKFPVDCSGQLYSSEVNNPFYFPLIGVNTVGTGTILATAAAVKALSEGQFGQFPLYAFTTEGVWAMEVSATGSFSAKQPVTRDVCINAEAITQLDNSVLFPTKRGIMLIQGSETTCITDAIDSVKPFAICDIPKGDGLVDIYNRKDTEAQVTKDGISLLPFQQFLAQCRMIYDYTNQHVIVYNPDVQYAYVFSLKSRMWGMIRSDIRSNPDSYPEALAVLKDGSLVDFSTSEVTSTASLIITRPFVLDNPDLFKTIDTVIQRGYFHRAHVAQVLYGSNDLLHWFTVWSSVDMYLRGFRGTPYKYFRLALICKLDAQERIFGCTVQFNVRMINQPR